MGSAICLEPCVSTDRLSVERYNEAASKCVDIIRKEVKQMNEKIEMDDLNIDNLIEKALHSSRAEVFKY
jgi:hypothetical protein